ncbi:hypothetical protein B0H13DRAFT_2676619 [Mycena leptocephala]|nr:hypothetical protein B0H13DRAFT_2676619 [Mycena leptocephala]
MSLLAPRLSRKLVSIHRIIRPLGSGAKNYISGPPKAPIFNPPRQLDSESPDFDRFIAAHFPVFPDHLLPLATSCDWASWSGIHFKFFCIRDLWHNLSQSDFIFKHCFKILGGLRPLAWRDLGVDPDILIAAGDEYFHWSCCSGMLTRYGGKFPSDEAFLGHVMARGGGLDIYLMGPRVAVPMYRENWRKADKQQRDLIIIRRFVPGGHVRTSAILQYTCSLSFVLSPRPTGQKASCGPNAVRS